MLESLKQESFSKAFVSSIYVFIMLGLLPAGQGIHFLIIQNLMETGNNRTSFTSNAGIKEENDIYSRLNKNRKSFALINLMAHTTY